MKPVDYAKAAGLGLAVLAANLLLLVVVVFAYSQLFARGETPQFYNDLAVRMGRWTAPIGGMILMFLAGYVFDRRRPQRNPMAFALAIFVAYALIDIASGLAMTSAAELFTPQFGLSLAITGAGGLAGGWLASRRMAA